MQNNFGLSKTDFTSILATLQLFPEVDKAWIFGSRAKGNFHNGSDIDIAIAGNELKPEIVWRIAGILNEETSLPYKIDVVDFTHTAHKQLSEHISRVGIEIYHR